MRARWLLLSFVAATSACASSSEVRCKPSDNALAVCQIGSHEECETKDDGCERCTCVPDRPDDGGHGPMPPE